MDDYEPANSKYIVTDYFEDDGTEVTYDFDGIDEANAKFDELKAEHGPEDNLHTLYLSHNGKDLRKYSPQFGIKDEYKDPTITECKKANSIEEAVAILNDADDECECQICHDMFDKAECSREDGCGWICKSCAGSLKSKADGIEESKEVPVVSCPVNDVITHSEDEKPLDCKMKKRPLDKPLTESVDRQALEAELKNSEEFKANWIKEVNKLDGIVDTFTTDGSDRVRILNKAGGEWCCYSDSPWGKREEEWTADTDEEAFDEMFDWCGDEFLQNMHDKYCSRNGIKESVDGDEGLSMDNWFKEECGRRGLNYEFTSEFDFGIDEVSCSIYCNKDKSKICADIITYHASEDHNAENPDGHTDEDDYTYDTMEEFMNDADMPDEFIEFVQEQYDEYAEELRLEREAEADDNDDDVLDRPEHSGPYKTYVCVFEGEELGTVKARDDDEAYEKMVDNWPEHNYSDYDGCAEVYEADDELDEGSERLKEAGDPIQDQPIIFLANDPKAKHSGYNMLAAKVHREDVPKLLRINTRANRLWDALYPYIDDNGGWDTEKAEKDGVAIPNCDPCGIAILCDYLRLEDYVELIDSYSEEAVDSYDKLSAKYKYGEEISPEDASALLSSVRESKEKPEGDKLNEGEMDVYQKAMLSFGDEDMVYEGYVDGRRWNGWESAWFTKEVADKIAHDVNIADDSVRIAYDDKADAYVIEYNDDASERETCEGYEHDTVDGMKKLYPLGSYSWTWQTVAEADDLEEAASNRKAYSFSKNGKT